MLWKYEIQSNVRQHVMLYRGSGREGRRNWISKLLLSTAQVHLEQFDQQLYHKAPLTREIHPGLFNASSGLAPGICFPLTRGWQ